MTDLVALGDYQQQAANIANGWWDTHGVVVRASSPHPLDQLAHHIAAALAAAEKRGACRVVERMEVLTAEVEAAHSEAKANARAERELIVRNQYVGRAWGLGDALADLRSALAAALSEATP